MLKTATAGRDLYLLLDDNGLIVAEYRDKYLGGRKFYDLPKEYGPYTAVSTCGSEGILLNSKGEVYSRAGQMWSLLKYKNKKWDEPFERIGNVPPCKEIATTISAGAALTQDGELYLWGDPFNGSNNRTEFIKAKKIAIPRLTSIAGGDLFFIMLTEDKEVYIMGTVWSEFFKGMLAYKKPTKLEGIPPIKKIVSGRNHYLLLTESGKVYGGGGYSVGQLDGIDTKTVGPSKIESIEATKEIAAGDDVSFFQGEDGSIKGFGFLLGVKPVKLKKRYQEEKLAEVLFKTRERVADPKLLLPIIKKLIAKEIAL